MLIENALADAVPFFHIDTLPSSVRLKVDLDVALLVVANVPPSPDGQTHARLR